MFSEAMQSASNIASILKVLSTVVSNVVLLVELKISLITSPEASFLTVNCPDDRIEAVPALPVF